MTEEHDDVTRYAAAVRAALADLPESDRDDLLEDLDSHLAEVAAESGEPLVGRLGSPEEYAAELRAAYGARGRRSRRTSWRLRSVEAAEAVRANPAYRYVRDLTSELRPVGWVVRGYLVAIGIAVFLGYSAAVVPSAFVPLLYVLLVIWASVVLGRRTPGLRTGWRRVVVAGNALVVLIAAPILASFSIPEPGEGSPVRTGAYGYEEPMIDGDVVNIYPYSKDGEPLEDVLLYDQNGRPVTIERGRLEDNGLRPMYPMGADGRPIRNAYPLTVATEEPWATPPPSGGPRVAIPPFPSPSPTASPTNGPTDGPTDEPSPSPTR